MKENEIVFLIEEIHSIYVLPKTKIFRMKKTVPSPDFDYNHYFFSFQPVYSSFVPEVKAS